MPIDRGPLARTLLDDGWMSLLDVRCGTHPPAVSEVEESASLSVVMPMRGFFVRHLVDRTRQTIGDPAHALFFRPREPYRVSHPAGGADRSLDLTLTPEASDSLGLISADLPHLTATDSRTDVFIRAWARALAEGQLDRLAGAEGALTLIDRLRAPAPMRPERRDSALVRQVKSALAEGLGERLTLLELGRLVGSSPYHLARAFRAETGLSIHRYRTTLRVRAALDRIEGGDRDLTRLAMDLGFADHSHMTNVIRRETGRPPSAFRPSRTHRDLEAMRTILQA